MVKRVNLNGCIMKRIHSYNSCFFGHIQPQQKSRKHLTRVLLHISQVSGSINPPSHAVLIHRPKGVPSSLFIASMKQHRVFGGHRVLVNVFLCCQTASMQHLTSDLPNLFQQHIPPLTWILSGKKHSFQASCFCVLIFADLFSKYKQFSGP